MSFPSRPPNGRSGKAKQPKHCIPVRGMGDIASEQAHGWRQVDRSTSSAHLRMQDVHHSDVVTGFDETVGERRPDKTRPTSDEHRC